jgi:uncharacterized delta-60 repeat protein
MREVVMRSRRNISNIVDTLEPRRLLVGGANDPSFSGDGLLTHSFGSAQDGIDSLVQPDGRVVVVGDTAASGAPKDAFIARYTSDGQVDTSFGGGDGVTVFNFGGTDDIATCVARQSDGKLVVAGLTGDTAQLDFFVARFNTNGTLDTSFSADGKVQVDFTGGLDAATGVAIDGAGRIWVIGTTVGASAGVGIAIARLTPSGQLDASFSGDGKVVDSPGLLSGRGWAAGRMVLDASDRPVVAFTEFAATIGLSGVTITGAKMGAARYTSDGAPDTTFSSDGKALVNYGRTIELGTSVALDPRTGRVVLAGTSANGTAAFGASLPNGVGNIKAATRANYAISRFRVGGGLDTSFSADGKLQVDFGTNLLDGCSDVVVDASGRITASGGSQIRKSAADFSVCRITPGGGMDASFDGDGKRIIDLGGSDGAFGMTIQSDGNTILVGHTKTNTSRGRVVVIRLLDD